MNHEHDADGELDEGLEGLWEPTHASEEIRSLEERLSRHRHRPQPWVVPAGIEQEQEQEQDEAAAVRADPWTLRQPGSHAAQPEDTASTHAEPKRMPVWRAQGSRGARTISFLVAAALVLFFLGDTLGWFGRTADPASREVEPYVVETLDGFPEVKRRGVTHEAGSIAIEAGDVLVCDAGSRAELHVMDAGKVRMEPGTQLRIDSAPDAGWRLYLERGQVTASIFAAPRLFQVGTPSGIAVDLGCVYTATVGDDGETILSVRGGQVSFETADRKVFVPDGARVVAWPGRGPGTPVWEDASGPLIMALARLDDLALSPAADLDAVGARDAVQQLARISDVRDSLSLWHLLDHPHPQVAREAFQRLSVLCPLPPTVDPADILARRPAALTLWRGALQTGW